MTSSTGTVTDTYSYTAFGESFSRTGTTTNPYQYTGQQFDSLTSQYSLRARYYNPALGRFLSQDTYPFNLGNPIELNRYAYVANDPVNLTDPTGQMALTERAIISMGVGGGIGALYGVGQTLSCGGNLFINVLSGMASGVAFGALYAYMPGLALGGGVLLGTQSALSAFQNAEVYGPNTCNGFNAAASMLMVAFSARGLASTNSNSNLTMLNPSTGQSGTGAPRRLPFRPISGGSGAPESGYTTLYRFANGLDRLTSYASRLPEGQREFPMDLLLRNEHLRIWLGELHASGFPNEPALAKQSPYISTLSDLRAGVNTPDPVLQGIIAKTKYLYTLRIPNDLLYYPEFRLSQIETEVLILADNIAPYVVETKINPYNKSAR